MLVYSLPLSLPSGVKGGVQNGLPSANMGFGFSIAMADGLMFQRFSKSVPRKMAAAAAGSRLRPSRCSFWSQAKDSSCCSLVHSGARTRSDVVADWKRMR